MIEVNLNSFSVGQNRSRIVDDFSPSSQRTFNNVWTHFWSPHLERRATASSGVETEIKNVTNLA